MFTELIAFFAGVFCGILLLEACYMWNMANYKRKEQQEYNKLLDSMGSKAPRDLS